MSEEAPLVSVLMGSQSDWEVMQQAVAQLRELGVPCEARAISAHRTPDRLFRYLQEAEESGVRCFIAGAGMAAHLPGVVAAKTTRPVLGVPLAAGPLQGTDALYSIVQMPKGVPVATFTIGSHGAVNAAIFAAMLLAPEFPGVAVRLAELRRSRREEGEQAAEQDLSGPG